MKKILVTGCNGQLGRAIRKEYAGSDVEFVNTDVTEGEGVKALDITDHCFLRPDHGNSSTYECRCL